MRRTILAIVLGSGILFSCNDQVENIDPQIQVISNPVFENVGSGNAEITFQITNNASGDFTYNYELIDGSAKAGVDYVADEGQFTISSGTTKTLDVAIINDEFIELNESLILNLSPADEPNKITTVTVDILNDDEQYTPEKVADGYITPDSYPSMELVWSDEFDGSELNTDNWNYEVGNGCDLNLCGWGNNELQEYSNSADNVFLQDGVLVIKATESASQTYSSGRIQTAGKQKFKFGRIDVRAKLPVGQGLWPAIWMLGANIGEVGWPKCGEIDIMEYKGQTPNIVEGTLHYDNNGHQYRGSKTSLSVGDFSEEYHVFTIIWDRNIVTWLVDYKPFSTLTSSQLGGGAYPFNNDFYFILNVAVGGNYVGSPDASTTFPQQMEIDYIRVFQ